jgi:hypothetical protein
MLLSDNSQLIMKDLILDNSSDNHQIDIDIQSHFHLKIIFNEVSKHKFMNTIGALLNMSQHSDHQLPNFHWSRCKSGCVHLFLGAVTLNFTPQQLTLLARTIAEIQQETMALALATSSTNSNLEHHKLDHDDKEKVSLLM